MAVTAIEISNLTRRFDQLVAVDDVSLQVAAGTTLGLIGPNGAGKTSLLRMLATLSIPDAGDVLIGGRSVLRDPRQVRRMLGFMPAEFGYPRGLTIHEYLEYFGSLYQVPTADLPQRIRDVKELTDLAARPDVAVRGLSTGNRQRLLLARTLLHDPDVLLLDEPASGLDPRARNELRAIIRTLATLGKTIIVSSHILPDLEDVSDSIAIMEAGKLVIHGDLQQLRQSGTEAGLSVRIRVDSAVLQQAADLLRAIPGVHECRIHDQGLLVRSEDDGGNSLLEALIRERIQVQEFSREALNLEQIFMRSTAGRVT